MPAEQYDIVNILSEPYWVTLHWIGKQYLLRECTSLFVYYVDPLSYIKQVLGSITAFRLPKSHSPCSQIILNIVG